MSADGIAVSSRRRVAIVASVAAACWLAAAGLYLLTEAMAASAFSPPYSYAQNYISDLGVAFCGSVFDGRRICSPRHGLMNTGFVVQGLLFLGGALAITRLIRRPPTYPLIGLAAVNCIGIGLVGIFPESGASSTMANVHVLGAFLAIVAGNATVLMSAFTFGELGFPPVHRYASIALASVAAASLVMLLVARRTGVPVIVPDGIWERLSVYTITAWEALSAVCAFVWHRAIRDPRRGGMRRSESRPRR